MKFLRAFLLIFGVTAFALGGWNLWSIAREYRADKSAYTALEAYAAPAATTAPRSAENTKVIDDLEIVEPDESFKPVEFPSVDFEELRRINPDVVGWIYSEDTPVNYPIVKAWDEEYYLTHLFNGESGGSGAIFLDPNNDSEFLDENSILYGHNMKNGAMFADLMKYKDQEFYEAHPRILLVTPTQNYVVSLFSGAIVSGFGDSWQVAFAEEELFDTWLQEAVQRSAFQSPVKPTTKDRILTLSTCTYEYDEARFVLMGILEPA